MQKNELVITKNLEIENEKEFDNYIQKLDKKYGSLVVSEETRKDTEKVIAQLRKLKKEINEKRKDFQREYEKPAKTFKEKIDCKLNEIEQIITKLDGGVKELENERKAKKKAAVEKIIEEMKSEYNYSGEITFNNRWLNKSYKVLDIEKDVKEQIKTAKRDAGDWELVKKYALTRGAMPEYYRMFIGVYTVADIQKLIDEDIDKKEKQQKEMLKEAKKKQQLSVVDANGEIKDKVEKVSFTVSGTVEEINELAKYIAKSNLNVIEKSERETIIGG